MVTGLATETLQCGVDKENLSASSPEAIVYLFHQNTRCKQWSFLKESEFIDQLMFVFENRTHKIG